MKSYRVDIVTPRFPNNVNSTNNQSIQRKSIINHISHIIKY